MAIENREDYLAKIEKRVKEYKVEVLSEFRFAKFIGGFFVGKYGVIWKFGGFSFLRYEKNN